MNKYDEFYIKWGQSLAEYLDRYIFITPNGITYFRLLFNLPMFACFYLGEYYYMIGAVLNEFLYLLDRTDGALARIRHNTSEYGHWLEEIGDRFITFYGVLFFVVLGLWVRTGEVSVWILLFFHVFAKYADRILVELKPENSDKIYDEVEAKNRKSIVQFIDTWNYQVIIAAMFLYYPLSFILSNPILIAVIISTLLVQVNWIGRLYLTLKYFRDKNDI